MVLNFEISEEVGTRSNMGLALLSHVGFYCHKALHTGFVFAMLKSMKREYQKILHVTANRVDKNHD